MLRTIAYFFSFFFHPLLILTYMLVILLLVNPYLFGVNNISENKVLIVLVFLSTFFIPAFSVLMMKFLGLIDSLEMKTKNERIGPYIATGIFYLWMFRNLLDNPNIPLAYKIFVLGATIGLFVAFFFNIFTKVSMHALGMGGLVAMTLITMLMFSYDSFTVEIANMGSYDIPIYALFMGVIIIAGMVSTSRLILDAHDLKDIYGGFVIGFGTQFLAFPFLL